MPFLTDVIPCTASLLPFDKHLVVFGAEFKSAAHGHRLKRTLRNSFTLARRRRSRLRVTLGLLHLDVVVVFGVARRLPSRGGALLQPAVLASKLIVRRRTCQPPAFGAFPNVDAVVFGGPMISSGGEEVGKGEDTSLSIIGVELVEIDFLCWWIGC